VIFDFYASSQCDPSGNGEGERPLDSVRTTTDSFGNANFANQISDPVAIGEFITATAVVASDGSTSEFSTCQEVVSATVPASELNVRCAHFPVWPKVGETVRLEAQAFDGDGNPLPFIDNVEVWANGNSQVSGQSDSGSRTFIFGPTTDNDFSYGCKVEDGSGSAFSGWRTVTTGDPPSGKAVPVLLNQEDLTKAIDVVFIADEPSYEPTDPEFIEDVGIAIRDGYYSEGLFLSNQTKFNFWISLETGAADRNYVTANSEDGAGPNTCGDGLDNGGDGLADNQDINCTPCILTAPASWDSDFAFAQVGAILHTDDFRDCANRGEKLFSTEPTSLRTMIHETGHSPFGLSDEYCCNTGYFQNATLPNMYNSLAGCQNDAPNANACRRLGNASVTLSWWTSDPASDDLMVDNRTPRDLDLRRINWMFGECDLGNC